MLYSCGAHNENKIPALMLYKEPEQRKNPYTGEPMKKQFIQYQERGIDIQMFKKWVTNNLSDFTHQIKNTQDYTNLVQNEEDRDINKVILFTKKDKIPPAIKALSAEFRDRVRFNVISLPEGKEDPELVAIKDDYEVKELPYLVVEQTYNVTSESVLDQYLIHDYRSKDYKIAPLI